MPGTLSGSEPQPLLSGGPGGEANAAVIENAVVSHARMIPLSIVVFIVYIPVAFRPRLSAGLALSLLSPKRSRRFVGLPDI